MAGRGTDIMLGGNAEFMAKSDLKKQGLSDELIAESNSFAETQDPEILAARAAYKDAYAKYKVEVDKQAELVRKAGGLFIIGTERHESRRIDNQLRGRSGRQGDPGETQFYLSLQDDVMRLFGSERVMHMMETLGIDEDTPIDAKILSGAIENAQKTVESRNYQARKSVLEYDDVMNTQRKIIYEQRRQVLDGNFTLDENVTEFGFKLRTGNDGYIAIKYDVAKQMLTADYTHSGDDTYNGTRTMPMTLPEDRTVTMRVLLDTIVVEAFGNEGEAAISSVYYRDAAYQGMEFYTVGGNTTINSLSIYEMTPSWVAK